jgi:hypothetical protein
MGSVQSNALTMSIRKSKNSTPVKLKTKKRTGFGSKKISPVRPLDYKTPKKKAHPVEDIDSDYGDDNIPDQKAINRKVSESLRESKK